MLGVLGYFIRGLATVGVLLRTDSPTCGEKRTPVRYANENQQTDDVTAHIHSLTRPDFVSMEPTRSVPSRMGGPRNSE